MKKEFPLSTRLLIYETTLQQIEHFYAFGEFTKCAICANIERVRLSMKLPIVNPILMLPELKKREVPESEQTKGNTPDGIIPLYWYPLNEYGAKKRIELLNQCVTETRQNIEQARERLTLYELCLKIMIEHYERGRYNEITICNTIISAKNELLQSVGMGIDLDDYPEILELAPPKEAQRPPFWFKTNKEGAGKRIAILETAIYNTLNLLK